MTDFELILSPTAPLESGRYPGLQNEIVKFDTFDKHKDVGVQLRDGARIYVDIYRPKEQGPAATLVAWSPYGKHGLKSLAMMPGADVDPDWVSPHVIWEGPDPAYWCPRGYAIVSPDPRGAWSSEGTLTFQSSSEADDGYDLIEWIARQPWSSGKVGMLGVSYLAISQWMIAAKQPPSLAAICPWEGLSDPYREVYFHGGIPERGFLNWWQPRSRFSLSPSEDILQMQEAHPLLDAYWRSKSIALEQIRTPAYVVAGWGDHGMHTRGSIEGFRRIGSEEKWLEVHGEKKWRHFYNPTSLAKQVAFFNHFLRGKGDLSDWPKVSISIRQSNEVSETATATTWPPPATFTSRLYLDCATLMLSEETPVHQTTTSFRGDDGSQLVFRHRFAAHTEIVGGGALHIWATADEHDEIDLFIALRKLDRDGQPIGFRFYSTFAEGPVALGWQRGSHRQLADGSSELRPLHDHTEVQPLKRGEYVLLDVELWPTGTAFEDGETLELVIGGSDLYHYDTGAPELGHASANKGVIRVLSSDTKPSYLSIPVYRQAGENPKG